jgi:hypothetical protein
MKAKPPGAGCHDEKKSCCGVARPRLCVGMTVAIDSTGAHRGPLQKMPEIQFLFLSFFSFFLAG